MYKDRPIFKTIFSLNSMIIVGFVLNIWIHVSLIFQILNPMEMIKKIIKDIPLSSRLEAEELMMVEGIFDHILALDELPEEIQFITWVSAALIVLFGLIASWAFWGLYKKEHWAYLFVGSVAIFSILIGVVGFDIVELTFGLYASYVLYENKEKFEKKGESHYED